MSKHLHIVAHDVPWPADFGGVIDLFYKIKVLHAVGINIHLHCFTSLRPAQKSLEKYCVSVRYYPRNKGLTGLSFRTPYLVQSRNSKALLKDLQGDRHPILLEGIHCTYLLQKGQLAGRKVFVRLHNVEYKYYERLAKYETNIIRKAYYTMESSLLKKYERKLATKASFWAVSTEDLALYKKEFGADQVHFLPVFLPWGTPANIIGNGNFCLYHGNLAINENDHAATWLLNDIFNDLDMAFVIAGKNPSVALKALAAAHPHTCIIVDPSEAAMQDLINKAQVNILPSFNNTGVKLKVLNALYNGRHCLVNKEAIGGSGLEDHCSIATTAGEFKAAVTDLFNTPFTELKMQRRSAALNSIYQSEKNALKLIAWIY